MSLLTLLRPDQRATRARVRTSACRGYVVELDPDSASRARPLKNIRGEVVHFRSIANVRDALRRRGVREATLVQRHACEELSALGTSTGPEHGMPVLADTGT